jgi:hypothetical protein
MTGTWKAVVCFVLTIGISGLNLAQAQPDDTNGATPSRIIQSVDETQLLPLAGNTHPLALPKFDQGLASPAMSMDRMLLLLKRSPEQEASLSAFMAEQYNPKSPNFHHWLQAKEFGEKYGPSEADIAMVTAWLQQSGFSVGNVNHGHTFIEFSGTAAQVQQAFHTEIHRYLVNGVQHTANDRDPQIPAALAPVVAGIASLHNFFPAPQSVLGTFVKKDKKTGMLTAVHSASGGPAPQLTYINGAGQTREDITPFDFATIYNELPLWNAGTTGAGIKIAISAVSDITLSDVATFRSSFGLPKNVPVIIHNGPDPGLNGAQTENTLDVEWSGATAPAATVVAVVSASTATTSGDELSDLYIIDNEVASIMSASYGECELNLGKTGNAAINAIWQQGAAEGISEFESSGDQGSTGCDDSNAAAPHAASRGLQVNGIASSPYITAVGGTDFTWQTSPIATYWNSSNSSKGVSAKGYIPEKPWNSTCADTYLASLSIDPTTEAFCNDVLHGTNYPGKLGLVVITGGSGGKSACTEPTGTTPATCKGGYTKPTWQAGTGVPKDGLRDLPDVSLFASDGYPDGINGSAYLICVSSNSPERSCDYRDPDFITFQEVGGTSVSSPAMAGIMALVLQNNGGAPQGLANPVFYALAAKENLATCNSSTVGNGSSCVFYDTTFGTNAQVCIKGSPNCVTTDTSDQLGIVSGYSTTKGYDLATGLGSVNATNLVNAWPSGTTTSPTVTLTPASLTFASTAVGTASAAKAVTLKNTSTSILDINAGGITIAGADPSSFTETTTCGATLAAGASCKISVKFAPAAAGSLTASLSVADNATGSPQTVSLAGTATGTVPVVSLTPVTLKFASAKVGSTSAAKVVTLKNTGGTTLNIASGGIKISGVDAASFTDTTTCGATVAAGASCTISVSFKPVAAGALTASLTVADNAAGSPQSVSLSGTATAAAPVVALTPKTLTFLSTTVGSASAVKVVTLKNTGQGVLDIKSGGIKITGAEATWFTKTTTCGTTVAPAASCTISITFKPKAAGAATASLTVADNAATSPQAVSLKGTGK